MLSGQASAAAKFVQRNMWSPDPARDLELGQQNVIKFACTSIANWMELRHEGLDKMAFCKHFNWNVWKIFYASNFTEFWPYGPTDANNNNGALAQVRS